jgi:histone acetyltransferase (RNA polymerase elongator complex component)
MLAMVAVILVHGKCSHACANCSGSQVAHQTPVVSTLCSLRMTIGSGSMSGC